MSYHAFINSLPPPYQATPGERVNLLHCTNCIPKGATHEVRVADDGRRLPFGIFWGSKAQCLQYMADRGLDCVNLAAWGEKRLPDPSLQLTLIA